jgi:Tfp pilus assembly protein PilF
MYNLSGNKRVAVVSALALTGALLACGGERDSQTRTKSAGLAQATPAPVVTPVTVSTDSSKPELANVSYKDAESVYRKGRYRDAAEHFDSYVESHPNSGWGHYMLGLSAWKSGDHGRAEQALLRAVALDSGNVKVRTNLGRVLLEQGRPADALPHVEKAVELAPDSFEVWRVLGNVKSELGRGEEAIEAYRQALIRNDKDAWSMNNYGLVLIKLGRHEEALLPLARAVELVPTSPVFQNNLGIAFEQSGQLGGARKAFGAAVQADSTYVKAKISLERVQTRVGDTEVDVPDLTSFSRSFVEEIQRWRTAPSEVEAR